jgi:hypothetical protein
MRQNIPKQPVSGRVVDNGCAENRFCQKVLAQFTKRPIFFAMLPFKYFTKGDRLAFFAVTIRCTWQCRINGPVVANDLQHETAQWERGALTSFRCTLVR